MTIETEDLLKFLTYIQNRNRTASDCGDEAYITIFASGAMNACIGFTPERPSMIGFNSISEGMTLINQVNAENE